MNSNWERKILLKILYVALPDISSVKMKLTVKAANKQKNANAQNSWEKGGEHTYIENYEGKLLNELI